MSISFYDRLRALPSVFSVSYLCLTQNWKPNQAQTFLRHWKSKGYVENAGERSGLYYNKIVSPLVTGDMKATALLTEYPSALLMGESVLHAAGWTTQIPRQISVAVLSRPYLTPINGFCLHPRPKKWYREHHNFKLEPEKVEFPTYGLVTLPPARALVDLYKDLREGVWKPDFDDLDLDDEQFEELKKLSNEDQAFLPEEIQQMIGYVKDDAPVKLKKMGR